MEKVVHFSAGDLPEKAEKVSEVMDVGEAPEDDGDVVDPRTYRRYVVKDKDSLLKYINESEFRGDSDINVRCATIALAGISSPSLCEKVFSSRGATRRKIEARMRAIQLETEVQQGRPRILEDEAESALADWLRDPSVPRSMKTISRTAQKAVAIQTELDRKHRIVRHIKTPSTAWVRRFAAQWNLRAAIPIIVPHESCVPLSKVDDGSPLLKSCSGHTASTRG